MNEKLKVWYHGELMTVDEMHRRQIPAEVYQDGIRRLTGSTSAMEQQRLHERWPTLVACDDAMTAAFCDMTDAERAADLGETEAGMKWDEMWRTR